MAQRSVALCDGKYIGIESIYTVINGNQINIPEKLKELRIKSQRNELFCPCGCGANLILVAGDRNLREQHFRLKDSSYESKCHVTTEGKVSVDSKIVLKCWLDKNLNTDDIETRVPINLVDDVNRKYEFSFLSRNKRLAISYCYDRANLSDEKLEILKANSRGIQLIYIVDNSNRCSNGQYPEALMKIQERQGYCMFLEVKDASYDKAKLSTVLYVQDCDGLWKEVCISTGVVNDYVISNEGHLLFCGTSLLVLSHKKKLEFSESLKREREQREENKKRLMALQKAQQEKAYRRRLEQQEKREALEQQRKTKLEEENKRKEKEQIERETARKRLDEEFKQNMESNFTQQEKQIRDAEGNRWVKCEFCGFIAKEGEFTSYGGLNHVNLGTCKACSSKGLTATSFNSTLGKTQRNHKNNNATICPKCGGNLRERSGPYGKFIGCSNFPTCKYKEKSRD